MVGSCVTCSMEDDSSRFYCVRQIMNRWLALLLLTIYYYTNTIFYRVSFRSGRNINGGSAYRSNQLPAIAWPPALSFFFKNLILNYNLCIGAGPALNDSYLDNLDRFGFWLIGQLDLLMIPGSNRLGFKLSPN